MDGHLNQVSILKNGKVMAIFDLLHHIYGGHVGFRFAVVDGSFFTILFDIRTVVNVCIDTNTKSLGSLKRNIYVIE